jgi:hypothetical protein
MRFIGIGEHGAEFIGKAMYWLFFDFGADWCNWWPGTPEFRFNTTYKCSTDGVTCAGEIN